MREILERFYILLSTLLANEQFASPEEAKVRPYLENICNKLRERLDRKDPITVTEYTIYYTSNLMVIQTKIKSLTYQKKNVTKGGFLNLGSTITFETVEHPLASALKSLLESCKVTELDLKSREISQKSNLMNENNTNQTQADDELEKLQAQLEAQKKEQEHKLEVEKLKAQIEMQRLENEKELAKAQLSQTQKQTQLLQEQVDTLNTTVVELREQNEKLNRTLHEMSVNASLAEIPAISKTAFKDNPDINKLSQVISDERFKLIYHLLNLAKKLNNTNNSNNDFIKIHDLIDDLLLNYKKPITEIINQDKYKDLMNNSVIKSQLTRVDLIENPESLKQKLSNTENKLAKSFEKDPTLKAKGYNLEVHTLLAIKGVYKPKSGTCFFSSNNPDVINLIAQKVKLAEKLAKAALLDQAQSGSDTPVKQKPVDSTPEQAHDSKPPVFKL